jgi:hypothetical protein
MKKLLFIGLVCCSFVANAQPNLILNGSFELNTAAQCWEELPIPDYNTTILYSHHFGDEYTTSFWELPCLVCVPQYLWGGQAKDGDWALILIGQHETHILPPPLDTVHIIKQGKISLELNAPLLNTKRYKLSFWIKDPPPEPICINAKNNYVNVGISNYEDSLGRHLITTNYGDTIWQQYTYVFETQMEEEYITVTVGVNGMIDYGVFIDNFVVTETEEPLTTGVNEIYTNSKKQLLKIVDILGKESSPNATGLLFYIYSDGTVEKRIVIE